MSENFYYSNCEGCFHSHNSKNFDNGFTENSNFEQINNDIEEQKMDINYKKNLYPIDLKMKSEQKSENIIEDREMLISHEKKLEKKNSLENLKILELIEKGRHSKVFKAKLGKRNKIVAVKVLDKAKKFNENEMKISQKLKNKNVNDIYSFYKDEKNKEYYIVMEYSKLGNLKNFQHKFLEKEYLSETMLCFICYQILNGLLYIHKCKIAHLDIKPQNILIDEYLNIKIIDFSISLDYSKIKTKKIRLKTVGTSFYMAPEILNSNYVYIKDLNKVDLFSLGVILFNMAFGYYPFGLEKDDAKNYEIIYQKIMKNNLEFDNDDEYYSTYFIDFLKLLLEKDINKRISINEALNNYWVKGAKILFEEKENLFNAEKFLGYLVTDHIKAFDDYVRKKDLDVNKKNNFISENKSSLVENGEKNSILNDKKNLDEKNEELDDKNIIVENEMKNPILKYDKHFNKNNVDNENEIFDLEVNNDNEKESQFLKEYDNFLNSNFEGENIQKEDNSENNENQDFFHNPKW